MSSNAIVVRGAREHNLQNVNVTIPRDKLIVLTGLSGSGKSSLAFDTIYAEGQRRYMESLSAYARQFLDQMSKPEVDSIEGLSPAISIDQKTTSRNPRSTVGTVTEIYDYLRLLFARVGTPHCYSCNRPLSAQTVQQAVDRLLELAPGTKLSVLAPIVRGRKGEYAKQLEKLKREGFVRVRVDGELFDLDQPIKMDKQKKHSIEVVVDRLDLQPGKVEKRLSQSIETAWRLAEGLALVDVAEEEEILFSERLACPYCEISYGTIEPRSFSFNSPHGACPSCQGLGNHSYFDPAKVVPNPSLSLEEGALAPWPWTSEYYRQMMESLAKEFSFATSKPWKDLSDRIQHLILNGSGKQKVSFVYKTKSGGSKHTFTQVFPGLLHWLDKKWKETDSDDVREELGAYQSTRPCEECQGARLKKESLFVHVGEKNIHEVTTFSVQESAAFFKKIKFTPREAAIAKRIVKEIVDRLEFLLGVGLGYLTLARAAGTLSGGEAQRIRMATQLGSSLVGVLYVLDEPSIGLHPRDGERLISTLRRMRDQGNTVLVVEHDESTIRAADHVIDMGPGAGRHGGKIVAEGPPDEIASSKESLTGAYLSGRLQVEVPGERKPWKDSIRIKGAKLHNLRELDIEIPLGVFTVVTGVSGSGKSSLVTDTLYPAAMQQVVHRTKPEGEFSRIEGFELLDKVIDIDQSPIGRTPRSNPATYTGVFTLIREFFAQLPEAKVAGYGPGRFSFNVKGGRCESCGGEGYVKIEMHFLPDIFVQCEACGGRRYNRETLDILYKGKNIADVLDLPVDDALEFFSAFPQIKRLLQTIQDVGLGYVHLGQSATTLSGGEAQRIKLSRELGKRSTGKTLYILDEPTTGLHFADVHKLLEVLHRLVSEGNTVVVIEHNLDVIKTADWIVDLGPEGGSGGGALVAAGTPEQVAKAKQSYTGKFLAQVLGGRAA
ncbi:MAG: excinuclease ABC subunit UvrA [Bdellovibrionota bacterium]